MSDDLKNWCVEIDERNMKITMLPILGTWSREEVWTSHKFDIDVFVSKQGRRFESPPNIFKTRLDARKYARRRAKYMRQDAKKIIQEAYRLEQLLDKQDIPILVKENADG